MKILRSRLFLFLLGVLISSGMSAVFAYSITASNVGFIGIDDEWQPGDVNTSINYLYNHSNHCIIKDEFYNSLKYVKTSDLLTAGDTANQLTISLDSGRYILVVEGRAVEYDTVMSLTGSPNLKIIGSENSSRGEGTGSYTDHRQMIIHGRGGHKLVLYSLDTDKSVTLTYSIYNTVPANDSGRYVSVGRVTAYKFDY